MGTIANSGIYLIHYNSGWNDWRLTSELNTAAKGGGVAAKADYVTVLRFTMPSITGKVIPNSGTLKFTVPYVRSSSSDTSGTFYAMLTTSDPTTGGTRVICDIPTSTTCDDKSTWNTSDQNIHYTTFTISNKNLSSGTTYYLIIGTSSSKVIQIGFHNADGRKFSIDYSYETYTDGSATISITDTGHNSFKFSGTIKEGTNNAFKSGTIYWTTNGTSPTTSNYAGYTSNLNVDGSSFKPTTEYLIGNKTETVKAYLAYTFERNSNNTAIVEKAITYHSLGSGGSISIKDNNNNYHIYKLKSLLSTKNCGQ